MYPITFRKELSQDVKLMRICAPFIARKAKAGQFVMIRTDETGERFPLTIADQDPKTGEITIIFQEVGKSTQKLGMKQEGDVVLDVAGPLGNPTEFGESRKAIVIGGGLGTAIAYPQAKTLFQQGAEVDVILGFRNKERVFLEQELREISHRLYITTDDGSYGRKGLVTDVLQENLIRRSFDLVIAVGPLVMMKMVSMLTKPYGIRTMVSMNPLMVDGTGMCGGCRITVGGKIQFACVEGPDFDGHQVDFDEAIRRQGIYLREEHLCRLDRK